MEPEKGKFNWVGLLKSFAFMAMFSIIMAAAMAIVVVSDRPFDCETIIGLILLAISLVAFYVRMQRSKNV